MTALTIEILEKVYRGGNARPQPALRDIRLHLGEGEFVCLVGPSGCGKTTLLNIVAGLDRDFQGRVAMPDKSGPPRIGYVFQNPRLLPWRTVRQNIDLALPDGTDPAYVEHLLQVVGLADALDQYPERLSLGMSRRAALVRAFAINPDLLLLDEPFVSLDPPTARRIREWVDRLWRERPHAVLFVTHDLREAIELGDRLVFLAGSPASVVADIAVDLPRQARTDTVIDAFRRRLHAEYPEVRSLL